MRERLEWNLDNVKFSRNVLTAGQIPILKFTRIFFNLKLKYLNHIVIILQAILHFHSLYPRIFSHWGHFMSVSDTRSRFNSIPLHIQISNDPFPTAWHTISPPFHLLKTGTASSRRRPMPRSAINPFITYSCLV